MRQRLCVVTVLLGIRRVRMNLVQNTYAIFVGKSRVRALFIGRPSGSFRSSAGNVVIMFVCNNSISTNT